MNTANEFTVRSPLERVTILKHKGRVVGLSPVHDYIFHPVMLENLSLYDWISKYKHEK